MAQPIAKTAIKAKAAGKPRSATMPRPKTIRGMPKKISEAEAHLLVFSSSAFMAPAPFMCMPTPTGQCQRFYYDAGTKQFFPKPGEPIMDCGTCRGGG